MPRRPNDPFKHKSEMTALAVLIRTKADTALTEVEAMLAEVELSRSETARLTKAKRKLIEIIDLVEGP